MHSSLTKTLTLIFIKYSGIMGTSSEITVYSLTAIKQIERLNFLSLLVSDKKAHSDSRKKCPVMQLIMNVQGKKTYLRIREEKEAVRAPTSAPLLASCWYDIYSNDQK